MITFSCDENSELMKLLGISKWKGCQFFELLPAPEDLSSFLSLLQHVDHIHDRNLREAATHLMYSYR